MSTNQPFETEQQKLKRMFTTLDSQYEQIARLVTDSGKLNSTTVDLINQRAQGNLGAMNMLAMVLDQSASTQEFIQSVQKLPESPEAIWDEFKPRIHRQLSPQF